MKWVRQPILMDRWLREERERWHRLFGRAEAHV
jgi:hypothetical protein